MKRNISVAAATVIATAGLLVAGAGPASAVPACGNTSLDYGATGSQGAAGTSSFVLLYRNHTSASCSLRGYPGLDAMASNGHVIAHALRTTTGNAGGASHGVQTITVPPHGYASAVVEWANFDPATSGPCRFSAGVNTIAPNTTKLVPFHRSVSICRLEVHPVVLGWTGRN